MTPPPAVIGHRGAAGLAPENSLGGIEAAHALGVAMVELDVRLTLDKRAILAHDDDLSRVAGFPITVSQSFEASLLQVAIGARDGADFPGERVPRLIDALVLCAELGLRVNLELKADAGDVAALVAVTVETVANFWPRGVAPPVISSFWPGVLADLRRAAPHLPRAQLFWDRDAPWLTDEFGGWQSVVALTDPVTVNLSRRQETPDSLAAVAAATGLPILVYTVNDPEEAKAWWRAGATGLFTDRPDLLLPRVPG